MDLEHEKRLADVENRAKSNTRRIDHFEKQIEAINNIATAVQVLATKVDGISDTVERVDGKVEAIEQKPAKRAEAIWEKIILAIVAALVGAALAHFGL